MPPLPTIHHSFPTSPSHFSTSPRTYFSHCPDYHSLAIPWPFRPHSRGICMHGRVRRRGGVWALLDFTEVSLERIPWLKRGFPCRRQRMNAILSKFRHWRHEWAYIAVNIQEFLTLVGFLRSSYRSDLNDKRK